MIHSLCSVTSWFGRRHGDRLRDWARELIARRAEDDGGGPDETGTGGAALIESQSRGANASPTPGGLSSVRSHSR
jgi:hypothetical protein